MAKDHLRESLDSEEMLLPQRYYDADRAGRRRSGMSQYVIRRQFLVSCAAFAIVSAVTLALFMLVKAPSQLRDLLAVPPVADLEENVESYVLGPPTQSFRGQSGRPPSHSDLNTVPNSDNLRNDTKYITSWLNAGWSTYCIVSIADLAAHTITSQRRNDYREYRSDLKIKFLRLMHTGKSTVPRHDNGTGANHSKIYPVPHRP